VTLVELLTVVLVIGILSAIAIPGYRTYMLRVKRTDAKVALTTASQAIERCFTRGDPTPTYVGCDAPYPLDTEDSTYTISVNVTSRNSYVATATAINGQTQDTPCGNFSINELGQQTVSGPKPASECW
jgi:type IV pilus assembly protein PilE